MNEPMVPIAIRIPAPLMKRLDEFCAKTGRTRSDVVREVLDAMVRR